MVLIGFSPSFLSKMHEKRGSFCIFLLKIAEKEGKTDLIVEARGPFERVEHHIIHALPPKFDEMSGQTHHPGNIRAKREKIREKRRANRTSGQV